MGHCLFMRKGETHTAPISGILASDLAVGSSVYLMENGVATEYLVVNQGKPSGSSLYDDSCNGTWLLRKDCHSNGRWNTAQTNSYKDSTVHTYLNSDFYNLFDSVAKEAIKQVKIPYVNGTGSDAPVDSGSNGLTTKIFLLSAYEIGYDKSYLRVEGASLSYFTGLSDNDSKRVAYFNGNEWDWWLRSGDKSNTADVYLFSSTIKNISQQSLFGAAGWAENGIRPALILPFNAIFDKNTLILKGVA